jgi:hypothetical protein
MRPIFPSPGHTLSALGFWEPPYHTHIIPVCLSSHKETRDRWGLTDMDAILCHARHVPWYLCRSANTFYLNKIRGDMRFCMSCELGLLWAQRMHVSWGMQPSFWHPSTIAELCPLCTVCLRHRTWLCRCCWSHVQNCVDTSFCQHSEVQNWVQALCILFPIFCSAFTFTIARKSTVSPVVVTSWSEGL